MGAGQQVAFAMGDATGETAGGISALATVGPAAAGASCDTTVQSGHRFILALCIQKADFNPGADFFYNLDGTLRQCA